MKGSARSVLVFGLYLLLEGLILMLIPNFLLELVGITPVTDVWVRVTGFAVFALGYYYLGNARAVLVPFFKLTVHIRILQFFFFLLLVFQQMADPVLMLFAAVELLSGLWTLYALWQEGAYRTE